MFEFKFLNNSQEELDRFTKEVLDKIVACSGTRRKQLYRKGHGVSEPNDCFSITYGYCNLGYISKTKTRKRVEGLAHTFETAYLTLHPELKPILQEFCDLHCLEKIKVSQVQINKNYQIPPHKDSGNVGESWLVGLGDYTGGETIVEYDDEHIEYNINKKFVKFNGSKYTHWSKPFDGCRYSLVFYNHKLEK